MSQVYLRASFLQMRYYLEYFPGKETNNNAYFIVTIVPRMAERAAYLQGDDAPEHVFPHAELHVKVGQLLVGLSARRPDLFGRTDVLGEIQDVTRRCGGRRRRGRQRRHSIQLCCHGNGQSRPAVLHLGSIEP